MRIPSILSNLQYLLKQTLTKPTTENIRSTLTLFLALPIMGSQQSDIFRNHREGSLHRIMLDILPGFSLSLVLNLRKHFLRKRSTNWLSCPATRFGMLEKSWLGALKTSTSLVRTSLIAVYLLFPLSVSSCSCFLGGFNTMDFIFFL